MAPLPENNTPRFRIHYSVNTTEHTMQIRSGASPAFIGGLVDDLLTNIGVFLFLTTVTTVEFAPSGSNIFNPVISGIEGNTYGAGAGLPDTVPWAYTFVGRTSGGRRVRLAVFGATALGVNYRFSPGESGELDAARALLEASGSIIQGIDGLAPIWKAYVNVQVNDHWVKEVRG